MISKVMIDVEKRLSKEKMEVLRKYGLYQRFLNSFYGNGIINIDEDDIVEAFNGGDLVGYINDIYKSKDEIKVSYINEVSKLNTMVLCFDTCESMSLYDVSDYIKQIIAFLKNDVDIIYGCSIDKSLKEDEVRVTAAIFGN